MSLLNDGVPPTQEEADVSSKLFIECQSCHRCEARDGITLSKCAGCGVALYCSKQCQRAAWPHHRDDCKSHQKFRSVITSHQNTSLDTLISFCTKLSGPLSKFGLQAFDLDRHPSRGLHDILFIGLQQRPGARAVKLSYTVAYVRVRPIASISCKATRLRLREIVRLGVEDNRERRLGGFDGVVMLLTDIKTGVCTIKSVAFQNREGLTSLSWKEDLVYHIENGITF